MCINSGPYHLTEGRIYSVEENTNGHHKKLLEYYIINDKGYRHLVEEELFIDIVEVRESKLNELGIK